MWEKYGTTEEGVLDDLEDKKMSITALEIFNAKFYNNHEIAVLKNVVMLRDEYYYFKIMKNTTLSTLLHNSRVEQEAKIEITLSMLDTDEEKLTRLEQLIRGW